MSHHDEAAFIGHMRPHAVANNQARHDDAAPRVSFVHVLNFGVNVGSDVQGGERVCMTHLKASRDARLGCDGTHGWGCQLSRRRNGRGAVSSRTIPRRRMWTFGLAAAAVAAVSAEVDVSGVLADFPAEPASATPVLDGVGEGDDETSSPDLSSFGTLDSNADGRISLLEVRSSAGGLPACIRDIINNMLADDAVDINDDDLLSEQEWYSFFSARLGRLVSVSEVTMWILYAVQKPQLVEVFAANSVTGLDFLDLVRDGGRLLRDELGITDTASLNHVRRQMILKLCSSMPVPPVPSKPVAVDHVHGIELSWNVSRAPSGSTTVTGEEALAQLQPAGSDPRRRASGGDTPSMMVKPASWAPAVVYEVERIRRGERGVVVPGGQTDVSLVDTDIALGQAVAYRYRVQAWNVHGRSGWSEAVEVWHRPRRGGAKIGRDGSGARDGGFPDATSEPGALPLHGSSIMSDWTLALASGLGWTDMATSHGAKGWSLGIGVGEAVWLKICMTAAALAAACLRYGAGSAVGSSSLPAEGTYAQSRAGRRVVDAKKDETGVGRAGVCGEAMVANEESVVGGKPPLPRLARRTSNRSMASVSTRGSRSSSAASDGGGSSPRRRSRPGTHPAVVPQLRPSVSLPNLMKSSGVRVGRGGMPVAKTFVAATHEVTLTCTDDAIEATWQLHDEVCVDSSVDGGAEAHGDVCATTTSPRCSLTSSPREPATGTTVHDHVPSRVIRRSGSLRVRGESIGRVAHYILSCRRELDAEVMGGGSGAAGSGGGESVRQTSLSQQHHGITVRTRGESPPLRIDDLEAGALYVVKVHFVDDTGATQRLLRRKVRLGCSSDRQLSADPADED